MNYALVLSAGMPHMKIFDIVRQGGTTLYEHNGSADAECIKRVLQSVSRLPVDILITDTDISPDTEIIHGLHAFRIARPDTRIVLFANRRQPGDDLVSGAVSLGIYDIIETVDEDQILSDFAQCLKSPYTYSRVVKWHKGFRNEAEIKKIEVRERVVIERRPIGKVTVSVAGVAHGVGCTHTSLSVASYLSSFGSVALVEDSQQPVLNSISGLGKEINSNGGYKFKDIDIYPLVFLMPSLHDNSYSYLYERIMPALGSYEYVVRDMGVLDADRLRELYRAESGILVVSASSWRIMDFVRSHNTLKSDFDDINIVSAFGTDKDLRLFKQVTSLVPVSIPLSIDPMQVNKETEVIYKKMFDFLLPDRKPKRKFGLF